MIELRWALQHRGYIEKERVLQFRHSIDGAWQPGTVWTAWQDVPKVDVPNIPPPQRSSS